MAAPYQPNRLLRALSRMAPEPRPLRSLIGHLPVRKGRRIRRRHLAPCSLNSAAVPVESNRLSPTLMTGRPRDWPVEKAEPAVPLLGEASPTTVGLLGNTNGPAVQ